MEQFTELTIVLKNFPFQERDRIVVCFTENRGKITGLAKGAIYSKRFGGSLDLLACSRVRFVQKPHAELARIEEAIIYREFNNLSQDLNNLTTASFMVEFCLRLIEPHAPARNMFVLLSNALFYIDSKMPLLLAVNTFLCKAFRILGYSPRMLLNDEMVVFYNELSSTSFKDLKWEFHLPSHTQLFYFLSNFLHQHIPTLPSKGLKSSKLLHHAILS